MIVMSMAQEDFLDAPQISVQGEAIRDHRMPIARIEEEIALVGLNKSRESMLPRTNSFPDGVFTKYRDPCFHPLVSFEPKFHCFLFSSVAIHYRTIPKKCRVIRDRDAPLEHNIS
jgi:hypothetical protein